MTTATVLFVAMLLDGLLGEPRWIWSRVPHPAVLMGRLVAGLDKQLNRGKFKRLRGVIALIFLAATAWLLAHLLSGFGAIAECLVVAILLAQKSLVQHVAQVASGLRMSLSEGRTMVARIVSRDTRQMNQSQIARSAIESAAENLSDGVTAPAFWFLVGGLPGLLIYKFVNTADSMIGYRTPRHAEFGWASARMDDLLNLIPARLTALIITGVSGHWALRDIHRDARLHRSPNAGWPEAAMSRALGISLAGPRSYDGQMQEFAWVNPNGRRELCPRDIDACVTMLWKSWSVILALCGIISLF